MSNPYGRRIIEARKKLGIGQRKAAKLWGFDDSTLQAWEHERCEQCAREPFPATAIHPRTNEPLPPTVAIANNVVARPREAWAHHVLRLIGAL